MKKPCLYVAALILCVYLLPFSVYSQGCSNLNLQAHADIVSTCPQMMMTAHHDILDRPYLYIANKESGVTIYDVTNPDSPTQAANVPITNLNGLHVMNLSQVGYYVYLALGNHFNTGQNPGMAIIDVTNPSAPVVKDVWMHSEPTSGAGIVQVEGSYAYLGAMQHGLIILNISDPAEITFVSQFLPDLNYPTPNPDTSKYNSRGMVVKNDIVYLCFDAGGLRIINAADKLNPVETGHYSNPSLNGLPRAYNNIILDSPYVYISVDYCGLEVLNISDTSNITLTSWWNPWNCTTNPLNWFSSPGHANEIEFDPECKLVFISTGKSDMHVVSVANPSSPDSCGYFGGVNNNIGTWGIGLHEDRIYLTYVCAIIPFASNWTGVKILTWNDQCSNHVNEIKNPEIIIYPNPSTDYFQIATKSFTNSDQLILSITDIHGRKLPVRVLQDERSLTIDATRYQPGFYFLRLYDGTATTAYKLLKAH